MSDKLILDFFECIENDDIDALKKFLNRLVPEEKITIDDYWVDVMTHAAENNYPDMLSFLMQNNEKSPHPIALVRAAQHGHKKCADLLLTIPYAYIEFNDHMALTYAITNGHFDIAINILTHYSKGCPFQVLNQLYRSNKTFHSDSLKKFIELLWENPFNRDNLHTIHNDQDILNSRISLGSIATLTCFLDHSSLYQSMDMRDIQQHFDTIIYHDFYKDREERFPVYLSSLFRHNFLAYIEIMSQFDNYCQVNNQKNWLIKVKNHVENKKIGETLPEEIPLLL